MRIKTHIMIIIYKILLLRAVSILLNWPSVHHYVVSCESDTLLWVPSIFFPINFLLFIFTWNQTRKDKIFKVSTPFVSFEFLSSYFFIYLFSLALSIRLASRELFPSKRQIQSEKIKDLRILNKHICRNLT